MSDQPIKDMTKFILDLKVADNYEAARAMDRFHRNVIMPLAERITKGWEFIIGEGAGKTDEVRQKTQIRFDVLKLQLDEVQNIYDTTKTLVQRHENLVNDLAKIYVGIRENILWKDKFPAELMEEQVKMMEEYYQILDNYLKNLDL